MSGRVLPRLNEIKGVSPEIAGLAKSADPYEAFAERIGNIPTWIFHGSDDPVVPVESSCKMVSAMRTAGNNLVKYDEIDKAGHEPLAFRTDGFFEWLINQQTNGK